MVALMNKVQNILITLGLMAVGGVGVVFFASQILIFIKAILGIIAILIIIIMGINLIEKTKGVKK